MVVATCSEAAVAPRLCDYVLAPSLQFPFDVDPRPQSTFSLRDGVGQAALASDTCCAGLRLCSRVAWTGCGPDGLEHPGNLRHVFRQVVRGVQTLSPALRDRRHNPSSAGARSASLRRQPERRLRATTPPCRCGSCAVAPFEQRCQLLRRNHHKSETSVP